MGAKGLSLRRVRRGTGTEVRGEVGSCGAGMVRLEAKGPGLCTPAIERGLPTE